MNEKQTDQIIKLLKDILRELEQINRERGKI